MSDPAKRKRPYLPLAVLLFLAVLVPPFINANLFRTRLARSVSGALGRNVTMGDVSIRLLPLPAFEIQNFVIADDSAFSAEPMLRAESVTARLRLASLWRGRLEIARLSFAYPSLNLVRNADGHWNIESLLAHASQVSAAPTGRKKPESRPRFPYIEADTGRINFKVLQEKKAHALVEADFALWQESENQWNMRLEARPTRTDANLSDTGTVRVEGSFRRADKIEDTPMKVVFDWQKSQFGQLTTLLYGRDRGWRGDVHISGTLEGMPQQFTAKIAAQVDDFHRYDIASEDSVRITANCMVSHSAMSSISLRNSLTCNAPLGAGSLELRVYARYWSQHPDYLSLRATAVPLAVLAQVYRHAKLNVPRDLTGEGLLNAYFSRVTYPDSVSSLWIGQGAILRARLSSAVLAEDLHLGDVRFGFSQVEQSSNGTGNTEYSPRLKLARISAALATDNVFTIDPFPAEVGGARPLIVSGSNSPAGLQIQIKGDAEATQLTAAAHLFGLELPNAPATGLSNVDLKLTGRWSGFSAPIVTGTTHALMRPVPPRPPESASNQQNAKKIKQP